jgi:hypothetical protein
MDELTVVECVSICSGVLKSGGIARLLCRSVVLLLFLLVLPLHVVCIYTD